MGRAILTFSALRDFRNCRRRYYNRFVREIVPAGRDSNLYLGDTFHRSLEAWFALDRDGVARDSAAIARIHALIDASYPNRDGDPQQKRLWHLARAMFDGYRRRYPTEDFEVVDVEREFDARIINPATGYPSRSYCMRGKVDLLVRMRETGELFIVEHKSAAQIDGAYIERLPLDFQVAIYSHFLSRDLGVPIAGVIYDVVGKAKLKQREGETQEEYERRHAELVAKSKTGRSSAKRHMPESDEEYAARLADKYDDPAMFHREALYLSQDDVRDLVTEVWDLTQQLNTARREDAYYRNTDFCFRYNRPCAYFPLCRSGDNPNVLENLYVDKPAHSELTNPVDDEPAF